MAQNETHPLLQILKSFNLGDMMLAFFLSVLVGLLLGALVYVLLTWASRRKKASARITRRPPKRPSGPSDPPLGPLLYSSTFLSVCRQPSLEPVGPLGSKPPGDNSTFRPAKKIRPGLEMGEDTVDRGGDTEDRRGDTVEDRGGDTVEDTKPNKRHSFWLGTNGLKGFLPPQSAPPPAYDSVIRAYEETCT
ncbi:hypothetical protein CesoFtcFv8_018015 [Champsocephalus esox]|uniref:Myc target protein 1 n=1 Tax=Champsocephalus esox TaxID=159716 RepID=A0AAN8BM13_9TELE|nr:hypothetical protein CesoFtcFv8_018015 [Champsocephalus esox]